MLREDIVLSVPAGKSYDLILEHFVYSCPDNYQYDETRVITFRTAQDRMERLFSIGQVIRLDPRDIDAAFEVPTQIRERIKGYISVAHSRGILEAVGPYRFYILAEDAVVELLHAPRTRDHLKGAHYFTTAELTSGTELVSPLV
jgi:hypothetical protein